MFKSHLYQFLYHKTFLTGSRQGPAALYIYACPHEMETFQCRLADGKNASHQRCAPGYDPWQSTVTCFSAAGEPETASHHHALKGNVITSFILCTSVVGEMNRLKKMLKRSNVSWQLSMYLNRDNTSLVRISGCHAWSYGSLLLYSSACTGKHT